jgi:hypothetical protein
MEYYEVSFNTEDLNVGKYPQIIDAHPGYDFSSPRSYKKLNYYEFPEKKPDLNGLLIDAKANLTEILTCQGVTYSAGLFVSKKIKNILEKSNIVNYKYYPVILHYGDLQLDNYEFIHVVEAEDIIDFKMSEFVLLDTQSLLTQPESIEINSMEEWNEKYPVYYRDKKRNISLNNVKLLDTFDLFRLLYSNKLYISNKLKSELETFGKLPLAYEKTWVSFY